MGPSDVWYVKFIGKIGGTKAVLIHFIERSENLQGTAEGVIGINALALVHWLWCRGDYVLGWRGDGDGCSTEGNEFPRDNVCGTIRSRPFPCGKG